MGLSERVLKVCECVFNTLLTVYRYALQVVLRAKRPVPTGATSSHTACNNNRSQEGCHTSKSGVQSPSMAQIPQFCEVNLAAISPIFADMTSLSRHLHHITCKSHSPHSSVLASAASVYSSYSSTLTCPSFSGVNSWKRGTMRPPARTKRHGKDLFGVSGLGGCYL